MKSKPTAIADDIRFTTKGDTLYAIVLAWPKDGTVKIKSLAEGKDSRNVTSVRLLGHDGNLEFKRDAEGLNVTLPETRPCDHAYVLNIN
ncbi:alpha-L-fucosidase C-terminal domain-containing protein [Novipirellula artificiosorum]|uniref:alpha-L-fucosidase C-terminal domain-containing protein n=1 Tax=Novipirellula artificiosorum TaxID=2528016 RepID=UPI0018CEE5B4|nr:alpha-L-fucosidase C-terminal domain-containing protein [Novipirellula artificiosorum]